MWQSGADSSGQLINRVINCACRYVSSYLPISKLSFVSKVLEKHIAIQHHMETHNLFDTFQSAYQ